MFSYRHAFHAGSHADVLKHTTLIAILRHLLQKDTALTVLDTHAGAGLYRLDSQQAQTSGEALQGVLRLPNNTNLATALADYLATIRSFNHSQTLRSYPGSPLFIHKLLRNHDRLKLFELHPTDSRALARHVGQLKAGRQVTMLRQDGFIGVHPFLPPPSRRALLLCDPSYEMKSDYGRVHTLLEHSLRRFATGVYTVWHPVIPRPEAYELPRRLKALARRVGKPWLHAVLTVKSGQSAGYFRTGLTASGIFVVNPPWTLEAALRDCLPQMVQWLGQDKHAGFVLEKEE